MTTTTAGARTTTVDAVTGDLMTIGRHLRRRMLAEGLEPGTYLLLQTIAERDSVRVTDLAACAGLDPSTVSRHVASLQRAGTVERGPDPEDGRAQRVRLTAEGTDLFRRALERRRALLADALGDWPDADVHTLRSLLGRVAHRLEDTTR